MVQPVIITLNSEIMSTVDPESQRRTVEKIKNYFLEFKNLLCKDPCVYPLFICIPFVIGGSIAWVSSKSFITGLGIGTFFSIIGFFGACIINICPKGQFRL